MEDKYGKKVASMHVSGMIYLPTVMLTILFAAVFFATLVSVIRGNPSLLAVVIIAGICMIGAAVLLLRQILKVRMDVYEDTLVQVNLFGTVVIRADDVRAMLWQFPGINPMNPRAARVNNTSAEFVFKDSARKTLKIQDSYYQDMEKIISAFQSRNNIPKDLENQKKKGAHRYDDI